MPLASTPATWHRGRLGACVVLGLILGSGLWAWTHRETTWLQELGGGPRWYVVQTDQWPLDRNLLPEIQSQLRVTAASYLPTSEPGAASSAAPRPPLLEIVQFQERSHDRRLVVWILGSCAAAARGRGDPEARFLDVGGVGACAFDAEFDVETHRFNWLHFNDRDARRPPADDRWRQVRGGQWWVDPQTLATMRVQLPAAADGNLSGRVGAPTGHEAGLAPISQYFVQVQGELDDGKRIVEMRGACGLDPWAESYRDWELMEVFDGGPCFFSARFDAETQRYTRFSFNGQA